MRSLFQSQSTNYLTRILIILFTKLILLIIVFFPPFCMYFVLGVGHLSLNTWRKSNIARFFHFNFFVVLFYATIKCLMSLNTFDIDWKKVSNENDLVVSKCSCRACYLGFLEHLFQTDHPYLKLKYPWPGWTSRRWRRC